MEQQECFMRIQMLGQEAEKIEQQIQAIDQQMAELSAVKESLENLNSEKGKSREILANLGKGIFAKAQINEEDLFVNVGREVVVKRTIKETLSIIEAQSKKLVEGREEFVEKIQELQENMQDLMSELQTKSGVGDSCGRKCQHEDCECEEPCEDCECEKEK